jgi:integrase
MPRRAAPPRLYLRKRRDGPAVWIILDRGRQLGTGALEHDRRKAHDALAAHLAERREPQFGKGHPADVLIVDVLTAYAEKHAPTVARPEIIGSAIVKLGAFFGDRKVGVITETLCRDYVAWRCAQRDPRHTRATKTIAPATAGRELAVLKAALGFCYRNKLLDRPIPVTLPPGGGRRERHLTRSEAAALLAGALGFYRDGTRWRREVQCRPAWRSYSSPHPGIERAARAHLARFILLGIYTGTRHAALLKLQWLRNTTGGFVDLEAGVIHRRAAAAVETAKRKPAIPIPPRLLPHLRRWRRMTARYVIEWRGAPLAGLLRTSWESARDRAGLSADVTPHVMRHTCATWLLQRGISVYDVAGLLGCSEQVVRDTYGHHAHDHLRGAVAAFSRQR